MMSRLEIVSDLRDLRRNGQDHGVAMLPRPFAGAQSEMLMAVKQRSTSQERMIDSRVKRHAKNKQKA
jgi:hypothetical protein